MIHFWLIKFYNLFIQIFTALKNTFAPKWNAEATGNSFQKSQSTHGLRYLASFFKQKVLYSLK